jgi:hypothetical protein
MNSFADFLSGHTYNEHLITTAFSKIDTSTNSRWAPERRESLDAQTI